VGAGPGGITRLRLNGAEQIVVVTHSNEPSRERKEKTLYVRGETKKEWGLNGTSASKLPNKDKSFGLQERRGLKRASEGFRSTKRVTWPGAGGIKYGVTEGKPSIGVVS